MGELDGIAQGAEQKKKMRNSPQMDTVASIWGFSVRAPSDAYLTSLAGRPAVRGEKSSTAIPSLPSSPSDVHPR